MLFANLSYFYQMLANINKMGAHVPKDSTYCVVDQTPNRITTARINPRPLSRQLSLGVGGGSSPNTAYGVSYNTCIGANNDSVSLTDYPYVVCTTQKFGEWKRSLTNEWLSIDGGCYFRSVDISGSAPYHAPNNFIRGTGIQTNTFIPNSSLYDTEEYDDYLIVIAIYPYTDDYETSSNIYHIARSHATQCYNYQLGGNNKGKNIANGTNNIIELSPWVCCPTVVIQRPWNLLVNLYNFYQSGDGTYELTQRINAFPNVPYVPIFRAPRTTGVVHKLASPNSIMDCTREIVYAFPNFEAIQRWFIDFGIKAYANINDLYEDKFPDDLEDDLGFPEDPQPDDPIALPDNESDPTDFAAPALSNIDLYNIYLLNRGGYISLKNLLLTTDIWNSIKNWLTQPLNSIYSLKLFPFALDVHDNVNITKSNELVLLTTTLSPIDCYKVLPTYRFTNFNLGSLTLNSYYGNYLDYQASYYLYVPCCSPIQLEPSSIINKTIQLRGIVDLVSGDITVDVIVDDNVIAMTTGNISYEINISFDSIAQTQNNIILQKVAGIGASLVTTNFGGALSQTAETIKDVAMTRNHIESSGSISFNNSIYNFTTPYLKICLKIPSQPSNYKQLQGLNSSATVKINQLEGYVKGTQYGKWQISGATLTELNIIKQAIQNGIYI